FDERPVKFTPRAQAAQSGRAVFAFAHGGHRSPQWPTACVGTVILRKFPSKPKHSPRGGGQLR
ncbi:MAG: hypothetical protein WBA12_02240, partial [Catalinimonas sp.]